MARRTRNLLTTLLLLGVVGSVAGWGVYSAFTATTTNSGNTITPARSRSPSTLVRRRSTARPTRAPAQPRSAASGSPTRGSLASSVKLYSSSVTNGTAFNLQVERGSGLTSPDNTMNCTGFQLSSTAYNGAPRLVRRRPTPAGVDGKAGGAAWATSDAVDYRFTITVVDDPTPNAHTSPLSSGAHTFTWEARNN